MSPKYQTCNWRLRGVNSCKNRLTHKAVSVLGILAYGCVKCLRYLMKIKGTRQAVIKHL